MLMPGLVEISLRFLFGAVVGLFVSLWLLKFFINDVAMFYIVAGLISLFLGFASAKWFYDFWPSFGQFLRKWIFWSR